MAASERRDGSMGLSGASEPEAVEAARRSFLAAAGMGTAAPAAVRQVHGSLVLRAGPADREAGILGEADGLVTAERGLPLLVLSADCLVGAVADRSGRALGVFHAGWRGVLAGMPAAVARAAGAPPADLRVVLGPAIGPCCYEVGEEVREAYRRGFGRRSDAWFRPGPRGRLHLDLPAAARAGLLAAGLPADAISPSGPCTLCGGDCFSHRRGDVGRHALVARIADAGDVFR